MITRTKILVGAMVLAVVVSAGAMSSCGPARRPDGGMGLLPVGAFAPDIQGNDVEDHAVRLSSVRGRLAVVYFYPRDETPGCTTEACAFRDTWARYEKADVAVFAVSRDSAESHRSFARNHRLPFPLVADEDGTIQHAYGVSSFLGMDARVSFLVGRDGRIAKVWPNVDPGTHPDEVLAAAAGTP